MKIRGKILYKTLVFSLIVGLASSVVSSTISFAEPSSFAKEDYFLLNYEGMLSEDMKNQTKLSNDISREDFTELAIKLYSKASSIDFNLMAKIHPFTDTDNEYIGMAYNIGFINGTSPSSFSPGESITREQLATVIYNELKILGADTSFNQNVNILDKSEISAWASDPVKFAVDKGIILKNEGGEIKPKDKATREEAISAISRVSKIYSWISPSEDTSGSYYKSLNGFIVPQPANTDMLIYVPDNSEIDLRLYHNGIVDFNSIFDFKRMDKQILDILDKHELYDYKTSFMISDYIRENWDETSKSFTFEENKYFRDGLMLTTKPSSSHIEIKAGRYLEVNIYN